MPFLSFARVLELRRQLEGTRAEVVCLGSDDYAASIRRWSDTCEKDAGAIVRVTTTSEVSEVVRFCRKHHIDYVVEAGGHSTTGSSSSHGGVVISMASMHKVLTDPASKTVCVQGGATWDAVNHSTVPYGLAVVGATASHIGVGGSTLGGGYGWLTGQHGLIIDQLLSVKMVISDGSIVEASEESNRDLFWAIRGAGQAFGIATEFVFRAHKVPATVFGGLMYFDVDKLPTIIEFANRFDEQQDPNSGFFFGFTTWRPAGQTVVLTMLFYNGTHSEAAAFFAPILSQPSLVNRAGMMSYSELNAMANVDPVPEGRKSIGGTNIMPPFNTSLVRELWDQFDHAMKAYPRMEDSVLVFEMLPYSKVVQVPVEETACANRGPYYNVGWVLCWHDPDLDAKMHALQRHMVSKIQEAQQGSTDEHVAAHANFAGHEISAQSLFGDNLPRLQEIKRKYDPQNVFRKWHDLVPQTRSL
ncbi:FAD-binding oxidoreductase [Aspergillus ibericus CBS 121593]|uniref:FAD-binding domain-containing protein n=1 Tax=Aspergillus ibericus CBS 121593 TaxID=1448316 RepID=A0A395GZS9_9EURO|nr:FAD-binding domain-containing protein [Aspergillus ibericus CBS 121593]RAL00843.1 FAD-binding domain-containing protein [Aspergillus ibericus CBS 121593]